MSKKILLIGMPLAMRAAMMIAEKASRYNVDLVVVDNDNKPIAFEPETFKITRFDTNGLIIPVEKSEMKVTKPIDAILPKGRRRKW